MLHVTVGDLVRLIDGVSVLDSRTFVYYYRSTVDGRIMLGKGGNTFARGGRIAPVFDQRSPYEAQLTQALHSFFPALRDTPITASWNGPSDRSVTGFPFFGRLDGAPATPLRWADLLLERMAAR